MTTKPLRIAMIGSRGVPATWGGIERHVEELGARLASRGHEVTVFCRTNYTGGDPGGAGTVVLDTYRGMRLRQLPTVGTKHLDAIVHSALSTAVAAGGPFDVLHYHALGPGLLALVPRLLPGARAVLTVHGLDDERAKWGLVARGVLKTAGWLSARVPHATIVVSRDLQRHYQERHGRAAVYVPNGVVITPPPATPTGVLARLGVEPGRYLLFVGRLVPEKAPDLLLRAFRRRRRGDGWRLVVVGDSSFTAGYVKGLREQAAADPRVVLAGFVYGEELAELYAGAACFVLPSLLEGLPLTLLEAAAHGTPVIASAIPPHVEVLETAGPGRRLVPPGDEDALAAALEAAYDDPARERAGAAALRRRVLATYRWEAAAEATEDVYLRVLGRRAVRDRRATAKARAKAKVG
jgi:glycosyltransferase involved in cell wall biosynthesis